MNILSPAPSTPTLERLTACAGVQDLAHDAVVVAAVFVDGVALVGIPEHDAGEAGVCLVLVDERDEFAWLQVVLGTAGRAGCAESARWEADEELGACRCAALGVVIPLWLLVRAS